MIVMAVKVQVWDNTRGPKGVGVNCNWSITDYFKKNQNQTFEGWVWLVLGCYLNMYRIV